MKDDRFSETSGLDKNKNWENEIAVRAWILYMNKYLSSEDAFQLPDFYLNARKYFTWDEHQQMHDEENGKEKT